MTRDETKKIVVMIAKAFPRFTIVQDKEGMDLWHECLSDIPYEDARACVIDCVKSKEFPPTIAEIRKAYDDILMAKKTVQRLIRQEYDAIRSYYPSCGELNNGWSEFQERCDSPEKAKRLRTALYNYVREVEQTGGNTEPFVEKIRTIAI